MINNFISFEDAYKIANDCAKKDIFLLSSTKNTLPPFLSNYYLESENCWMFFRREDILFPKENSLIDCAYVVSKKGEARGVVNYRNDIEKAKEYLKVISDYFSENDL